MKVKKVLKATVIFTVILIIILSITWCDDRVVYEYGSREIKPGEVLLFEISKVDYGANVGFMVDRNDVWFIRFKKDDTTELITWYENILDDRIYKQYRLIQSVSETGRTASCTVYGIPKNQLPTLVLYQPTSNSPLQALYNSVKEVVLI